jgi:predicted small secreted protein
MKVTVPAGIPAILVTVALKVTACPTVDGFGDELIVVLVALRDTVTLTCPATEL